MDYSDEKAKIVAFARLLGAGRDLDDCSLWNQFELAYQAAHSTFHSESNQPAETTYMKSPLAH